VNVTAWANGLEVTGGGTGVVSHAGLGLLRRLSDKTGLTRGLSQALFSGRLVHHDRGRVLADISCAIADGARAISDFRVLADQGEAFGQVASVPTAYRTLEEITRGGTRTQQKLAAAVSAARRYVRGQVVALSGCEREQVSAPAARCRAHYHQREGLGVSIGNSWPARQPGRCPNAARARWPACPRQRRHTAGLYSEAHQMRLAGCDGVVVRCSGPRTQSSRRACVVRRRSASGR